MPPPGNPDRVTITFACPPDRCRPVILALVAVTIALAAIAAVMDQALL